MKSKTHFLSFCLFFLGSLSKESQRTLNPTKPYFFKNDRDKPNPNVIESKDYTLSIPSLIASMCTIKSTQILNFNGQK
jgi:hypothetical protein